ncbi:class II histone deacetylase [Komagataeibacter sp. FXV2]|nr:class II histone deacetylase [Komagataeibacter sp. FXV2]
MKRTGFFTDERCFWHVTKPHIGPLAIGGWVQPSAGSGTAESPDSKRRLKNLVDFSGLSGRLQNRSARAATREDLLRVHPASYLERFRAMSEADGGEFAADTQASFSKGSYDFACVSSGLAIAAVDAVMRGELDNAYALCRPPGHHCLPDMPMGFCFLANIPIAIRAAQAAHGLRRVAVVDWDVHHGNGTEAIFYDSADVLTISIHQENCYPPGSGGVERRGEGAGEGHNLNVPLLPGGGHEAYVGAMERIVMPALLRYQPELIIIACGYDAGAFDPLARMMLGSNTYRYLIGCMMKIADACCGGRLVAMHEGGYSEAYVPFCGHALLETLADTTSDVVDPVAPFIAMQQPGARFVAFQNMLLDEQAQAAGLKT